MLVSEEGELKDPENFDFYFSYEKGVDPLLDFANLPQLDYIKVDREHT